LATPAIGSNKQVREGKGKKKKKKRKGKEKKTRKMRFWQIKGRKRGGGKRKEKKGRERGETVRCTRNSNHSLPGFAAQRRGRNRKGEREEQTDRIN